MKQLVIFREDPKLQATPSQDQVLSGVQGTAAYMDELVKAGKGTSPMFFTDVHGGGMIIEADTAYEINSIIAAVPIRSICTVEAYTISEPAAYLAAMANAPTEPGGGKG